MKIGKKGFTIVEIVVALAVIAIISLTATSIVLSSQNVQRDSRNEFLAAEFCNNSVAVFRSAAYNSNNFDSTCQTFTERMKDVLNITVTVEGKNGDKTATVWFNGSHGQTTEEADDKNFKCYFTLSDDNTTKLVTLNILYVRLRDNKTLIKTTYSAALGGAV